MILRDLFESEVLVRLSENHDAFICTKKWAFFAKVFSKTNRIAVAQLVRDHTPHAEAKK